MLVNFHIYFNILSMKKIAITKIQDVWVCDLFEFIDDKWQNIKIVDAKSFSELMIKIGENNWIDLINKN